MDEIYIFRNRRSYRRAHNRGPVAPARGDDQAGEVPGEEGQLAIEQLP